jgi:hypothetical protein
MRNLKWGLFVVALSAAGSATSAPDHQVVTGPVAEYWMSASTSTGMGGMAPGPGGGRPDMAAIMRGAMNPNAASHRLVLQLGSSRPPTGAPAAEHDPPAGLGVGPALPLLGPEPQAPAAHEEAEPGPPPQYQTPHGRMLIFWGCGEHAGPNQPYVIDFASLGSAQGAQQFAAMMRGLAIDRMRPPSPSHSVTYGEWPNRQSEVEVPPEGSLVGDHTVRGDYTPEIHFSLGPNQDFLPPFAMTENRKNPSGSATLGWAPMPGARGFFATMIGSGGEDQVVMWTSSATQAPAFGMPEYLGDGEIARLRASGVLMAPEQTTCTIPVEAAQAAGRGGFFTLAAYGGEVNFAYPPRPPAPQPWHIQWQAKVRYRSSTGGLVGMSMGRRGDESGERPQRRPQPRPGLGSFIPGVGGFIP